MRCGILAEGLWLQQLALLLCWRTATATVLAVSWCCRPPHGGSKGIGTISPTPSWLATGLPGASKLLAVKVLLECLTSMLMRCQCLWGGWAGTGVRGAPCVAQHAL